MSMRQFFMIRFTNFELIVEEENPKKKTLMFLKKKMGRIGVWFHVTLVALYSFYERLLYHSPRDVILHPNVAVLSWHYYYY